MNIYTYKTSGGKDLIFEYIDKLPKKEMVEAYRILETIEEEGLLPVNTRQLRNKLWEIKFFRHNRIMYILIDKENIYLLHACRKQKGKAEKHELQTAFYRLNELEKHLGNKIL